MNETKNEEELIEIVTSLTDLIMKNVKELLLILMKDDTHAKAEK